MAYLSVILMECQSPSNFIYFFTLLKMFVKRAACVFVKDRANGIDSVVICVSALS